MHLSPTSFCLAHTGDRKRMYIWFRGSEVVYFRSNGFYIFISFVVSLVPGWLTPGIFFFLYAVSVNLIFLINSFYIKHLFGIFGS